MMECAGKTRTYNPWLRGPMPDPLGHGATGRMPEDFLLWNNTIGWAQRMSTQVTPMMGREGGILVQAFQKYASGVCKPER